MREESTLSQGWFVASAAVLVISLVLALVVFAIPQ